MLILTILLLPLRRDEVLVEVKPGSAVRTLAQTLQRNELISSAVLFEAMVRLMSGAVQAGEYPIAGESTLSLAYKMAKGHRYQHAFTIVEGWDLGQLIAALQETPALKHTLSSIEDIYLHVPNFSGTLLAETYFFEKGYTDLQLVQRAHHYSTRLAEAVWRTGCQSALKNPQMVLTLASLVEKEASVVSEMPAIANVLLKRLNANMRLQVDPTVYFAVQKPYEFPLTREDLQFESPYNTYHVSGLPPGPIATVSATAIKASCQGNQDNFWYYVAKGNGTHQFSRTHEEHIQAVNQYIRGIPHDTQGQVVNH